MYQASTDDCVALDDTGPAAQGTSNSLMEYTSLRDGTMYMYMYIILCWPS